MIPSSLDTCRNMSIYYKELGGCFNFVNQIYPPCIYENSALQQRLFHEKDFEFVRFYYKKDYADREQRLQEIPIIVALIALDPWKVFDGSYEFLNIEERLSYLGNGEPYLDVGCLPTFSFQETMIRCSPYKYLYQMIQQGMVVPHLYDIFCECRLAFLLEHTNTPFLPSRGGAYPCWYKACRALAVMNVMPCRELGLMVVQWLYYMNL